jgi:protein AFG1
MLDIHKKMHDLRKQGHHEDPIPYIADDLLKNSWLLCFDEFQVTDVADALILRRLFSAMLHRGFVMVATSNRPPNVSSLSEQKTDKNSNVLLYFICIGTVQEWSTT